jgi:hypothetical protein
VPVEVVRQRSHPAPTRRYAAGPVRNFSAGGRDLLAELHTWLNSLPDRPTQQPEDEEEPPTRRADPIRAVMPPSAERTSYDSRVVLAADGYAHSNRDPVTGRELGAASAPITM